MIFDKHVNLKYKFGNKHFWSEGYYVNTVGLNEATIKSIYKNKKSMIYQWINLLLNNTKISLGMVSNGSDESKSEFEQSEGQRFYTLAGNTWLTTFVQITIGREVMIF